MQWFNENEGKTAARPNKHKLHIILNDALLFQVMVLIASISTTVNSRKNVRGRLIFDK